MSHDVHDGPEGAFLFDGCEECDERSADPIEALLRFDDDRFLDFTSLMLAIEYGVGQPTTYLTANEAKVGRHLYYVSLLVQRNPAAFEAIELAVRS